MFCKNSFTIYVHIVIAIHSTRFDYCGYDIYYNDKKILCMLLFGINIPSFGYLFYVILEKFFYVNISFIERYFFLIYFIYIFCERKM